MQIVLAYALDRPDDELDSRISRVRQLYRDAGIERMQHEARAFATVGLRHWDAPGSSCQWPLWSIGEHWTVACGYPPLGYQSVIGDIPIARGPEALAARLDKAPYEVARLTAPFTLAALQHKEQRLLLVNDALGLGRLFAVRFAGGWAWSNRPSVALAFAGLQAEADLLGWRYFAGAGWFMDDTTPLRGVTMLAPGTRIEALDGQRVEVTSNDPLPTLASPSDENPLAGDGTAAIAADLVNVAHSVCSLWTGTPVVDLSGGRGSRLVAAAFLSTGLPVILNTNAAIRGEADTAEELVARLPANSSVEHRVNVPAAGATAASAGHRDSLAQRIDRWHLLYDGFRSPTYLPSSATGGLDSADRLIVGGAAGELAHGHYYMRTIAEIERLPRADRLTALAAKLTAAVLGGVPATPPIAACAVADRVNAVFAQGIAAGREDGSLLDIFYLLERLRRWGGTADRAGVVSTLLAPEFVRAALGVTSAQRTEAALHRAVTAQLVPQWADVPYFAPAPADVKRTPRPRLWDTPERDDVDALLEDTDSWTDSWHRDDVRKRWAMCLAGSGTPRDEILIQRVLWRSRWDAHCTELNRITAHARPTPRPLELSAPSAAAKRQQGGVSKIFLRGQLSQIAHNPRTVPRKARALARRWLRPRYE